MSEINGSIVTAQDFAVQIWNLPNHKDWRVLRAQLWNYIDNVMLEQKKIN
jgi:hypothetical protein